MKKISRLQAQNKASQNVIASLRMENLSPDITVIRSLKMAVGDKKIDTPELIEAVRQRHVALRSER